MQSRDGIRAKDARFAPLGCRMRPGFLPSIVAAAATAVALVSLCGHLDQPHAAPAPQVVTNGGYRLGADRCGAAPGYPRLPIGMRPGYCAGLVASKADGLVFPRTIDQIPGWNLFVVADKGAKLDRRSWTAATPRSGCARGQADQAAAQQA